MRPRASARPSLDREVLELLHDEPDNLAVADAIAATQVRRSRALPAFGGAAVAAAVIVSVLLCGCRISA